MAQMVIVWHKLDGLGGDRRYAEVIERVLGFLRRMQTVKGKHPGIRGGIAGSFPIDGEYGQFKYLNWAAKFYVDALLLESYGGVAKDAAFHAG
jgi:hypothetical protein